MHLYHRSLLLGFFLCSLSVFHARATHMAGGEISYRYLGSDVYQISVTLYRDCLHGDPQAIAQDSPLELSIFTGNGAVVNRVSLTASQTLALPYTPLTGSCWEDTAHSCVSLISFTYTVPLPSRPDGYLIANERCCMGDEVQNVINPISTGLRLQAVIPGTPHSANSSPVYSQMPPVRVCANSPFTCNFGASDPDGDSLVYSWVPATQGAAPSDPVPKTISAANSTIAYAGGAAATTPFGANGFATLDSKTGIVTGRVLLPGKYLLAVQAREFRGNKELPGNRRTYILDVTDCGGGLSASILRDSITTLAGVQNESINQCNGARRVAFRNTSKNATAYRWDFGVPGTNDDTSTQESPVYDYPAAGRYLLTLAASNGTCVDSFQSWVVLSDEPVPAVDFVVDAPATLCPDTKITLTSQTAVSPIALGWDLDGGQAFSGFNTPSVTCSWSRSGTKTVRHWIRTPGGCLGAAAKTYEVSDGNITVSPDTVVVRGALLELRATRGANFKWYGHSNAVFANGTTESVGAVARPNTSLVAGRYTYYAQGIGENGCPDSDTTHLILTNDAYVFVPTAFSPNGDGHNDVLRPRLAGGALREFAIFNRAGQRVFQTSSYTQGWDGRQSGSEAAVGTYFWMVRATDESGQPFTRSGDVTLVR